MALEQRGVALGLRPRFAAPPLRSMADRKGFNPALSRPLSDGG